MTPPVDPLETAYLCDDATHIHLDKLVFNSNISRYEPSILPMAAQLLAHIVSNSDGMLKQDYKETETTIPFLEKYPILVEKIREAWKKKTFREIRNLSTTAPELNITPEFSL
jgi:hypothetical protein